MELKKGTNGYVANDFIHDGKYFGEFAEVISDQSNIGGTYPSYSTETHSWSPRPKTAVKLLIIRTGEIVPAFQGSLFDSPIH